MLVNLPKQNKDSKLAALKFRLYLAKMTSVDIDNFPKSAEATILTNPLLPGEVFHYMDSRADTINPNAVPGESPLNGVLTISPIIDGISKKSLAWAYDNVGEDFIAIWERCSDGQRFIAGDPCSGGLKLAYASIGTQEDGTAGIAITLTGKQCPNPYWFYDGPLLLAEADLIPADATTFALTANSQYQVSANTAPTNIKDISNVTDADVGRIIEVIGSGSSNPSTFSSSEKFILSIGLNFDASAGRRISFRITKTDTGYAFFEVFRA